MYLNLILDNIEFTWSMMPQDTAIGGEEDGNSGDTLKLMLNLVSGGAGMSNCCEAPLPVVSSCKAPSLPGREIETVRGDGRREESTYNGENVTSCLVLPPKLSERMLHHIVLQLPFSCSGNFTMKDFLFPTGASMGISPDQGVPRPRKRTFNTTPVQSATRVVGLA